MLISGATGGLGKAFTVECAGRGWDLYLTDLRPEALAVLSRALRNTYDVEVRWQACDLTDPDQRSALFEALRAAGVRFGALINVAGTDHEGLFCDQSREHIRSILRLNIEGTVDLTHTVIDLRDPSTTLRIINTASLAAFYPMPFKATYAASKRFLMDFSLALREELAGQGVTVTALCPAGMPTTQDCIAAIEAQGWAGWLTTQNTGTVAAGALDAALKGRAIHIPGLLNRIVCVGRTGATGPGGTPGPQPLAGRIRATRAWQSGVRARPFVVAGDVIGRGRARKVAEGFARTADVSRGILINQPQRP